MTAKAPTQKRGNVADISDDQNTGLAQEEGQNVDDETIEIKGSGLGFSGKKAEITIPSTRDSDGKEPVFASCNGTPYLIKRDKRVRIPVEILEVLQNAIQVENSVLNNALEPVETPRHAIMIHRVEE